MDSMCCHSGEQWFIIKNVSVYVAVFTLHCLPYSVWFLHLAFKPVECDTSVVFVCVWGCSCIFHSLGHY